MPLGQITGVGYGDIVAASLVETIVTLAVQIVGVMFFGLLLSTIRWAVGGLGGQGVGPGRGSSCGSEAAQA